MEIPVLLHSSPPSIEVTNGQIEIRKEETMNVKTKGMKKVKNDKL